MTKKAVIISGFPGVGKTYYTQNADLNILDSDSSKFSWIKEGVRNTSFPKNYIEHIRKNIDKVDVILVSSHKVVRDALVDNGIHFILVYPDRSLKEEYIKRFQDRGSNSNFINMIDKNWNSFIDDIENSDEYKTIKLESGKFLNDLLNNE